MYSKENFERRLKKGQEVEEKIYQYFLSKGFNVEKPVSEEGKSQDYYTENQVDLWVEGIPIEIKSRNVYFTSVDDFPFSTIFVDTVDGWERKKHRCMYIVYSTKTNKAIAFYPKDNSLFIKNKIRDHKTDDRDVTYWVYEITKEKLKQISFHPVQYFSSISQQRTVE